MRQSFRFPVTVWKTPTSGFRELNFFKFSYLVDKKQCINTNIRVEDSS